MDMKSRTLLTESPNSTKHDNRIGRKKNRNEKDPTKEPDVNCRHDPRLSASSNDASAQCHRTQVGFVAFWVQFHCRTAVLSYSLLLPLGNVNPPPNRFSSVTTLLGSFGTFVRGQGPMHRNCNTLLVAVRFGGSSWLFTCCLRRNQGVRTRYERGFRIPRQNE